MSARPLAARLAPLGWIVATGFAIWLVFGHGFVQYDSFYALDWGSAIAHGHSPDTAVPLAPTPHPLATLLGVILSPFGDGAAGIALAIAFLSLGALAYLLFRLGEAWFHPLVGLAAAAIMLTREPLLSDGVRAYIDIPYMALVLWALLVETRRPRAGAPVLGLLAVAGLLRPEAWLFSAAYLAYLAIDHDPARGGRLGLGRRGERDRGELLGLAAIAAAAPLLWGLYDLATAGDALHSFSGTRDTVETLGRETGLGDALGKGPFRLGEILREPGLFGAAAGLALALAFARRRGVLLGAAALVLALAAFAVLATAGLAVITRYLLLAAAILSIFCAAALLGWVGAAPGARWRRAWMGISVVVAAGFVAFVPSQADRLSSLEDSMAAQQRILDDLHDLADSGQFSPACAPVTVPNHRPVPFLALWLDRRPSEIVSAQLRRPIRGYFVAPASPQIAAQFTLDPHDPKRLSAAVPPGFKRLDANRSWVLYQRC
ncbi:MAG: hypothetical protein QOG09_745 [Solirubrobacterales bacterium]|jgi:hypothetical protein|nr:hypothetical protein [Solirubrobacterales bacterium]MDX6662643.1 hypothetical protein [Solirubrobacterales bacterium]